MSDAVPGGGEEGARARPPFKVWDHIGVISGVFLGLLVVALLVVLAAAGDQGALAILVVLVAGLVLIIVMGQMRGGRTGR